MSTLHDIAPLTDLPENEGILFRNGPHQIAVFRQGDSVHAIDNVCPHAGASLYQGYIEGQTLSCPWHCWEFEIDTGKCITVEDMDVDTFPITIENGMVKIELPD
jgi:NAD(P)H-dependent nitrite reductase small subunit